MSLRRFLKESSQNIITIKHIDIDNYQEYIGQTVNVTGNVNLGYLDLAKLPITFIKVSGYFNCAGNRLTSLEGAPKEVGRYFKCSYNRLTSLEGAPKEVDGNFDCRGNKMKFTKEDVKEACEVSNRIFV